jgi:hypothetical protein
MSEDLQQDALNRLNAWLEQLEDQARQLLAAYMPGELEPAQTANLAGKYVTLIVRLLELRQQFTNEGGSEEERLLRIIFGEK